MWCHHDDCACASAAAWHTAVAAADQRYHEVEQAWLAEHGAGARPDQQLLRVRMGVVNILAEQGHTVAAERLCGEVAAAQVEALGVGHQDTLRSRMNLAHFRADAGDAVAALRLLEGVGEQQVGSLGVRHPDVLLTRYNRGCLLAEQGDHAAAEKLCAEVAQNQADVLGEEHPDVRRTQANLAAHGHAPRGETHAGRRPPFDANVDSKSCIVM